MSGKKMLTMNSTIKMMEIEVVLWQGSASIELFFMNDGDNFI
jgi:hypothetical protein